MEISLVAIVTAAAPSSVRAAVRTAGYSVPDDWTLSFLLRCSRFTFLGGVIVGYGMRAIVSIRRRERAGGRLREG